MAEKEFGDDCAMSFRIYPWDPVPPKSRDGAATLQKQSPLASLAAELLLSISGLLEPTDSACLALTCFRTASIIGVGDWSWHGGTAVYYSKITERWQLLSRLELELPSHHLCFRLLRLAKNSQCVKPRQTAHDSQSGIRQSWRPPGFCEVRLVMNRHLFACNDDSIGLPLDFLAASQPWESREYFRTMGHRSLPMIPYYRKFDIEPRVVENELYFHIVSRVWLSTERTKEILSRELGCDSINDHPARYCYDPHPGLSTSTGDKAHAALKAAIHLELDPIHGDSPTPSIADTIIDTRESYLQFKVFNHGNAGVELVCSLWSNLGGGRSISGTGWAACFDPMSFSLRPGFLFGVYPRRFTNWWLDLKCKRVEAVLQSAATPDMLVAVETRWAADGTEQSANDEEWASRLRAAIG